MDVSPVLLKHCPRCNRDLPATTQYFSKHSRQKDGLRYFCKDCRHTDYVADLARNPDLNKQSAQRQRENFHAKSAEEQQQIRLHIAQTKRVLNAQKRQLDICQKCFARPCEHGRLCEQCYEYQKQWRKKNANSRKATSKRVHDKLRAQVFTAYGGKCVNCGESHFAFLSVDHVNNDGGIHRRSGLRGIRLYYWLRRNGFPQEDFQMLCHNCNWEKFARFPLAQYEYGKRWRKQLQQEVFAAYGDKCACCGCMEPCVLTVDHVYGKGDIHRQLVGGGSVFYVWLRKNHFPQEQFQLLCRNCNHAKFAYGECPHCAVTPLVTTEP